jgi:membrane dipeptidase
MSKRVEAIKQRCFIADAHLDLAYDIVRKRSYGGSCILERDYYQDMVEGGLNLVISSLFIDEKYIPEMALKRALLQVEALLEDIEESDHFEFCLTGSDVESAYEKGKISVMLSFEGIEPIYNSLELFGIFKRLGVRGVGLCWSRRNYAADGADFVDKRIGVRSGLTTFGLDLLDKIYDYNIYLDLSHINDEGFNDSFKFFNGKIMVSHTNSRELNYTMRNISDEQIRMVADRRGYIGINGMNFAVSDGSENDNVKGYCDHIDHVIKIGGEDCLGFGFDFNNIILKYIPDQELVDLPREPFDCIDGYKEIPLVIEELLNRGYSETTIEKILGKNLLDFLCEVQK